MKQVDIAGQGARRVFAGVALKVANLHMAHFNVLIVPTLKSVLAVIFTSAQPNQCRTTNGGVYRVLVAYACFALKTTSPHIIDLNLMTMAALQYVFPV